MRTILIFRLEMFVVCGKLSSKAKFLRQKKLEIALLSTIGKFCFTEKKKFSPTQGTK